MVTLACKHCVVVERLERSVCTLCICRLSAWAATGHGLTDWSRTLCWGRVFVILTRLGNGVWWRCINKLVEGRGHCRCTTVFSKDEIVEDLSTSRTMKLCNPSRPCCAGVLCFTGRYTMICGWRAVFADCGGSRGSKQLWSCAC